MAGKRQTRTAMQVLDTFPAEAVYEWVAQGEGMNSIADRLGIARTGVHAWMNRPEHVENIARARKVKASAMVEEAMAIADNASPEDVPKAKLRTDIRRWVASKLDRDTWGDDRGPQVAIQINGLHVDSLRVRNLDTEQD